MEFVETVREWASGIVTVLILIDNMGKTSLENHVTWASIEFVVLSLNSYAEKGGSLFYWIWWNFSTFS